MQTLLEVLLNNAAVATLLALVAAGLSALCRRPALTHRLWLLVLLKLVTPPLVPVHLPRAFLPEAADPAPLLRLDGRGTPVQGDALGPVAAEPDEAEANVAPEPAAPETTPAAPSWAGWLIPVWLLTALAWLAWNGLHLFRFRRLLRHAVPAPPAGAAQAHALAGQVGLRRCPPVLLVPGAVPPMVWGLGAGPRLLFPSGLLDRLDDAQRASLLLHELAHVRRGDHWVRLLELVVVPLYWWHPVVWWGRRELHEAEEQCCDAWVVWALAGSGRTYAVALLQALAFCARVRSPLPAAASGIGQVPHLRRRLTMIVQAKTPRALSRVGAAAVLGLGLLLLPPLLRVAGQDPKPLQPATEPPADRDRADKTLEALKKAIQYLEEQRAADKGPETVQRRYRVILQTRDEGGLKQAAADVDAAEKAVVVLRKQLAAAEGQLAQAQARMAEMKKAPPAADVPATPLNPPLLPPKANPNPRSSIYYEIAPRTDRLTDLEQKLDRVTHEIDALRKELHREHTPVPAPQPGYPPASKPEPPSVRPPAVEPPPAPPAAPEPPTAPPAPAPADPRRR